MKTIMTEQRKQIIEKIKKTGIMTCWDEFALIPTVWEETFNHNKLEEIKL